MNPTASIVIATRNRKEEALKAIASCLMQDYEPLEILVYDDASTDGTSEVIQAWFPQVLLFREEERKGQVVLRNKGLRQAAGNYVFIIDDDAFFSDKSIVRKTVEQFKDHPEAFAIAIPFVEPNNKRIDNKKPSVEKNGSLRSFVAAACVLKKDVTLAAGGFRELLVRQCEERDLSIRMLERGYRVIYGASLPMVHMYSSNRDWNIFNKLSIRNSLLFDFFNIPHPFFIPRMLIDTLQLFLYKISFKGLYEKIRCLALGWFDCIKYRRVRKPVSIETYRLYRRLPHCGAEPMNHHSNIKLT